MIVRRDVVAVGASAGGVEALRALAAGLPADYPGVLLVVLHMPREAHSALPAILRRSGPLPAASAVDGETLQPGRIYVAPTDHHFIVLDGRVRLTRGPAENGHRPAIDPLFRSVARSYGRRAVGVVLSGTRDDGAAGLVSIVARGGTAVVQDPDDALYAGMPRSALAQVDTDHVAPAAELGGLIAGLAAMDEPADLPPAGPAAGAPMTDFPLSATDDSALGAELAIAELEPLTTDQLPTQPSGFGCPSCGGSLFEITAGAGTGPDGRPVGDVEPAPRFRCRVGHAWSAESLLGEQAIAVEGALWIALRALEEKSALSRRMAGSMSGWHHAGVARFHATAEDAEAAGATIRRLIARLGSTTASPDDAAEYRPPFGSAASRLG